MLSVQQIRLLQWGKVLQWSRDPSFSPFIAHGANL